FEKCIEIAEKTKNTRLLGYGLMNAAETCARLGDLENAEKYANEALKIFKKLDEKYMIASYYTIMGIIGVKRKAWDDAEKSFNESVSIFEEINIPYYKAIAYFELGKMFRYKGELENARKNFEHSLAILESLRASTECEEIQKEIDELK
ncbi:MAG: tetratricopeptide repeat protein, partial [Thermoplasmata archaeon]